MNEIEASQITIARLAENPVYQEYIKLSNIITEGKVINELILLHQQRIANIQQQQELQKQQYQEQANAQQFQQQQQQMMADQYQTQPRQAGRPPMQRPIQQTPRQQVDSFGNPLTPEQRPAPVNNTKQELGIDEEPIKIDGMPSWND